METASHIAVNGSDIFNYMQRYVGSDNQIQVVLEIDGCLDEHRLWKAIRLSASAEPVLGCRFVEHQEHPYWQPRADLDSISWGSLLETQDRSTAMDAWLSDLLDMDHDPMVKGCIIRAAGRDTLCLKINHTCSDVGGCIQYVHLLASLYQKLGVDPAYRPVPNLAERDQSKIFKQLGFTSDAWNTQQSPEPLGPGAPFTLGEAKYRRQSIRKIPMGTLTKLRDSLRQEGVTINDLVLAAYVRALYQHIGGTIEEPIRIIVTGDLRRYLPAQQVHPLCNLSGIIHFHLEDRPVGTYQDTVRKVSAIMKRSKDNKMGLSRAATFLEFLAQTEFSNVVKMMREARERSVKSGKMSPILSNFGMMSPTTILFDNLEVTDAYIVTTAEYAPGLMLGASTYRDWMTFCIAFFASNIATSWVDALLDTVVSDLCG